MTPLRLGINGVGRVGSSVLSLSVLRARDLDHPSIGFSGRRVEVVAINDVRPIEQLAYQLGHDSLRRFPRWNVSHQAGRICVDDHSVRVFAEQSPREIPWEQAGVDYVLECTGRFRRRSDFDQHLRPHGPRRVIVGALCDADAVVIIGINHARVDLGSASVISAASCTAHAMAPILEILDRAFGVRWALLDNIHALDPEQPVLDGGWASELTRTRGGAGNIIPTASAVHRGVAAALPHLAGRMEASSARVPVSAGCMFDITCTLANPADGERVVDALRDACSETSRARVVGITDVPWVSSDIVGDTRSAVIDVALCRRIGPLVRVAGWFDNETAYAARLLDLAGHLGAREVETPGTGAGS